MFIEYIYMYMYIYIYIRYCRSDDFILPFSSLVLACRFRARADVCNPDDAHTRISQARRWKGLRIISMDGWHCRLLQNGTNTSCTQLPQQIV